MYLDHTQVCCISCFALLRLPCGKAKRLMREIKAFYNLRQVLEVIYKVNVKTKETGFLSVEYRYPHALTINIINGGLECSISTPPQVNDRVGFYQRFCQMLGVSTGDNMYCDRMAHY
jgi:Chitinase class I